MKERIVITGLGVVSALGINTEKFLHGLQHGISGIKKLNHFNTDELFQIGGEVEELVDADDSEDRASQMLKMALREALSDSKLTADVNLRVGAVVGSAQGGLKTGEKIHALHARGEAVKPELWYEYPLNRLLYYIDTVIPLTGPEVVISNACVSSTMAMGVALDALNDDLADLVIVAGVDTMTRFVSAGFQALKAVTSDICRPFDKNRDGIIPGEGAAVVILEKESIAVARGAHIYAELSGYGSASDAVHMTAPDREGSGAHLAIQMALAEAGLEPREIDFVIPHGTGTGYNDAMESTALKKIFGPEVEKKPVSSIKSTLGHTMGAAGIMSAITAILALEHGFLPANLNYETCDEELGLNVVTHVQHQQNKHILVMTSAFGGSNAVAVFSEPNIRGNKEGVL